MKNYEYKENEITINEKTTKFPDTIEEVIENDNYIFVRLAVRLNGDDTTNDEISNVYVLKKMAKLRGK